jgi:hypothetical protein
MQTPGVHIEILQDPMRRESAETERACAIANALTRAKTVLVERPER